MSGRCGSVAVWPARKGVVLCISAGGGTGGFREYWGVGVFGWHRGCMWSGMCGMSGGGVYSGPDECRQAKDLGGLYELAAANAEHALCLTSGTAAV